MTTPAEPYRDERVVIYMTKRARQRARFAAARAEVSVSRWIADLIDTALNGATE